MMESREAAPERSSLDAEQFNVGLVIIIIIIIIIISSSNVSLSLQMAASYLRSQFSVPHHLVPNYEDVKPTNLIKRRLSKVDGG